MAERHDFRDAYLSAVETAMKLRDGSCSLEDYMVETQDYGLKTCDLLDHMLDMLHQIDNRLDGIEKK